MNIVLSVICVVMWIIMWYRDINKAYSDTMWGKVVYTFVVLMISTVSVVTIMGDPAMALLIYPLVLLAMLND